MYNKVNKEVIIVDPSKLLYCDLMLYLSSDSSAQHSPPGTFPTSPSNDDELAPEVCMINEFTATAFAFY